MARLWLLKIFKVNYDDMDTLTLLTELQKRAEERYGDLFCVQSNVDEDLPAPAIT